MQVEVAQEEWQWAVREEDEGDEKDLSNWRKSGASRPARLREWSSKKVIIRDGCMGGQGYEGRGAR